MGPRHHCNTGPRVARRQTATSGLVEAIHSWTRLSANEKVELLALTYLSCPCARRLLTGRGLYDEESPVRRYNYQRRA